MEKVLTVVVPTYNMEKYLDRCLSSLIIEDDKMDMLEVLVINDGSKDRSSEIAHGYEARYPQTFRVIDKENGNYGSCVNRGMDEATGKYFRILDADDWFETHSLSEFLTFLASVNSDVIFTDYTVFDSDKKNIIKLPQDAIDGRVYTIDDIKCGNFPLDDFLMGAYVRMHHITYRLDLILSSHLRLQTGISYTDTEFAFFPMKDAANFCCKHLNLYQYNACREGQTMSVESLAKSLSQMYLIIRRLYKDYSEMDEGINKKFAGIPLKTILYIFYKTSLLFCKPTPKVKLYLRQIDDIVKGDEDIWHSTDSYIYRRIRYVFVWRRFGLSYRGFLFSLYDMAWSLSKSIKDFIRRIPA